MWPVGLSGGLLWEGPLCANNSVHSIYRLLISYTPTFQQVVGWRAEWKRRRPFPLDMAGFALHLRTLLRAPTARFSYGVPRGFQESHFLTQLGVRFTEWFSVFSDFRFALKVTRAELEPRAANCTQLLVWHTRSAPPKVDRQHVNASAADALLWET